MSTYKVDNIDGYASIQDSTDSTKKVKFDLTNISTSTTRTLMVPNNNLTIVGENTIQTVTNKTINADNNTLSNISNTQIKAGAAIDAAKIADGSVSNTKFQYLGGLASNAVGESDSQVLTNKTFTGSSTYLQDNVDNTKKVRFDLSGVTSGQTRDLTLPDATTELVGTGVSQTLTNKSIDADSNTITNIDNADIKAGAAIDASKIANGSVSNTEFQYISTVTSDVQTQLGTKVETASNKTGDQGVFSSKSDTDLQFKSLSAGTNISLSSDANAITINSTVGLNWQGTWVSQNYVVDDAVEYNGSAYVCKLNTVSSEVPTNTTYWDVLASKGDTGTGLNWQGAWVSQNYVVGDGVEYNGSAYICILNTVSNEVPTNTTYWDLLVAKGDGSSLTTSTVSATTTTSTTSSTYVVINSMTMTPASGTYMVWFSASGDVASGSADANYAIHIAGTIVAHSVRHMGYDGGSHTGGYKAAMHTQAEVTVNGSQTIDVRYNTSTSMFTVNARSMLLLKVA